MAKKIWDEDITKNTDWSGDESTENLPVSGRAIQKFIKDTLNSKAGVFYYDAPNSRFLIFSDEETRDEYLEDPSKTELIIAFFNAPSNYKATIELVDTPTKSYIRMGSTGNYIRANFDIQDLSGISTGDSCTATITISSSSGSSQKIARNLSYGTQLVLNIDDYIQEGNNVITINIVGTTTFAATTIGLTVFAMSLSLTDNFDITQIYTNEDQLEIPFTISGSGTKRVEWYIDGVQIDYDGTIDDIVAVTSSRVRYINLTNMGAGRHNLQYRAYIDLNDGDRFYSDILYRDFVIEDSSLTETVILASFTIPANIGYIEALQQPIPLYGVVQYESKIISYCVYDKTGMAERSFYITFDGNTSEYYIQNVTVYNFIIQSFNSGVTPLLFKCNETTMTFNANIEASTYKLDPITDTTFEFSGKDRENSSPNRSNWSFGQYTGLLKGFNWTENSGWNNGRLIIPNGASFVTDFAPFATEARLRGNTFEIEFKATRVLDESAPILDLRTNNKGLLITASEIIFNSRGNVTVSTKYKPEENIRVSIVVNPVNTGTYKGLLFIYVDGILTGAVEYPPTDSFLSNSVVTFTGTENAIIELKQIRCYTRALTSYEILNNFILYRDTTQELVSAYDRNDIYDSSNRISSDKLAAKTPIIIITGNVDKLQNFTKDDKKTYVRMDKIEIINLADQTKNMTLINPSMRCQGTSSMEYPRKNFRFYTQADSKDTTQNRYVTQMFDYKGNEITGANRLYAFKEGAQPVSCWCLKADYAESSSTHNTGVARLWNNVMKNAVINPSDIDDRFYMKKIFPNSQNPCRTIAQHQAQANEYNYDVRTTVDGFPITLFYHEKETDPLIFLGKYNWNNDKSTESVYGFKDIPGFDNEHMECWEVINGDFAINQFIDLSTWNAGKNNGGWQDNFESRYPDDSGEESEAIRAEGALKTVCEWLNSTKGASGVVDNKIVVANSTLMNKFKTEKWDHLDVYKIAAYYIYLMRFGGVDQTVKNAMFTTEDGEHWFYINYDNDTINGVRNDGALRFDYTIDRQSEDPDSAGTYCYAGHSSVLWNNLEADDEFMEIVKKVDQALYTAGLTYSNVIDMFNNQQSAKWAERTHNEDYEFKYLEPLIYNDNNQLSKLQGPRKSHRQWWLSHRFAIWDAKNGVGSYLNNFIGVKALTGDVGINEHVYVTPAVDNQLFGYGAGLQPVELGVVGYKGTPIAFEMVNDYYVGSQLNFYNAAYVKTFDCSEISSHIGEFHFDRVNSEAFDSELSTLILGTANSFNNTGVRNISGLSYFKYLENFTMRHYNAIITIDLSSNRYLKTVDVRDCNSLTNVNLPIAAPITEIHYSSTIQTLTLTNLSNLRVIDIQEHGKNIYNINIRNCPLCTNNPDLLLNWIVAKNGNFEGCSVYMDNIVWNDMDPEDLITIGNTLMDMGQTNTNTGYVTGLRGKCNLTDSTQEIAQQLMDIFGATAFQIGSEFYINAPDSIFVTGPSKVLAGNNAQYTAVIFSQYLGTKKWLIASGSRAGTSIDENTGLLTTMENGGGDSSLTIRCIHRPTQGSTTYADFNVVVKRRIYPTSSNTSIEGPTNLNDASITQFIEEVVYPSDINGNMTAQWTLTGDINSYVSIQNPSTNGCTLVRSFLPSDLEVTGTLQLVLKKVVDGSTVATVTKTLTIVRDDIALTSTMDAVFMQLMYDNGFAAHENYMTKNEAAMITEVDLQPGSSNSTSIFYNKLDYYISSDSIKDLTAFKYFTGLTKLPTYLFYCPYGSNVEAISLPNTIEEYGSYCLYGLAYNKDSLREPRFKISLPGVVKNFDENAFAKCAVKQLVTNMTERTDSMGVIDVETFYAPNLKKMQNFSVHLGTHSKQFIIGGEDVIIDSGYNSFMCMTSSEYQINVVFLGRVLKLDGTYIFNSKLNIVLKGTPVPPSISAMAVQKCSAKIFVPFGKSDVYKSASNWSSIADNIYELDENGNIPEEE